MKTEDEWYVVIEYFNTWLNRTRVCRGRGAVAKLCEPYASEPLLKGEVRRLLEFGLEVGHGGGSYVGDTTVYFGRVEKPEGL